MGLIGAKSLMLTRDWRELAQLGQAAHDRVCMSDFSCDGQSCDAAVSQIRCVVCQHCYPSPFFRPAPQRAAPAPFSANSVSRRLAKRRASFGKTLARSAVLRDPFPHRGKSRDLLLCVKQLGFSQPLPPLASPVASTQILNVGLPALPLARLPQKRWALTRSSVRPQVAPLARHAIATATFVTDPNRPSGRQDTLNRRAGRWACAAVLHAKDRRICSTRS